MIAIGNRVAYAKGFLQSMHSVTGDHLNTRRGTVVDVAPRRIRPTLRAPFVVYVLWDAEGDVVAKAALSCNLRVIKGAQDDAVLGPISSPYTD